MSSYGARHSPRPRAPRPRPRGPSARASCSTPPIALCTRPSAWGAIGPRWRERSAETAGRSPRWPAGAAPACRGGATRSAAGDPGCRRGGLPSRVRRDRGACGGVRGERAAEQHDLAATDLSHLRSPVPAVLARGVAERDEPGPLPRAAGLVDGVHEVLPREVLPRGLERLDERVRARHPVLDVAVEWRTRVVLRVDLHE